VFESLNVKTVVSREINLYIILLSF